MMQPQLWGGVECTINRVRNNYLNQIQKSGHSARLSDFAHIASLGVTSLRHGVLWEWVEEAGWDWPDASLSCLRQLKIQPIVGLLHHGSGPTHTSLIDPAFPEKFAAYAGEVARRYPWLTAYTPINEPLTTARFSGLYGHWYPHHRDDRSFVTALLHQLKATVLAMRAIRAVQPAARLVQTEDLGRTSSTPALAYQADFETLRRWITFDLLTGEVDPHHGMVPYLRAAGATDEDIFFFAENPCPPSVLGINYYLTSDRFLDENIDFYPAHAVGGNGRHTYADVEAVRVAAEGLPPDGITGSRRLLTEAWRRYGIPVAVTEVHNGAHIEDQIRWFADIWNGAVAAAHSGVPVTAVTAWALLGSHDWNSLVTEERGHYERGPLCPEGESLRETELAGVLRQAARGQRLVHPALKSPGWWKTSARLLYASSYETTEAA